MNKSQNIIEVLEGRTPQITPFTIYDWEMELAVTSDDIVERIRDDRWKPLLDQGLTIRHHCPAVRAIEHDVKYAVQKQ